MAATLSARQLVVTRGPRTVLDRVDLTLSPGERVGVVGPNGVGKSTLLMALACELDPDSGRVETRPPGATVGHLPQEPERSATETVLQFLARRTGVQEAQHALDAATIELAEGSAGADDRYSLALERWLALGAADLDARIGEVSAELGLPLRLTDPAGDVVLGELSGGEAARVSLASLLLSRFDVYLLDEPTNDLDLDGLDRLERWVVGLDAPVALVSHDRTFLERVVTGVVELDEHTHRATRFAGGWTAYLNERERARRRAQAAYDEYATTRQALLDRRQREREWVARGTSRVRRSDEPDRNIRAYRLAQTERLAGRAARIDRALERLDVVEEPRRPWELRLTIPTVGRSGDMVAALRSAVVERDAFRLGPVDLEIVWGDRMAIVGRNGAGKSTLIDLIVGRCTPLEGEARLGASVVVGEIEQARTWLVGEDGLLAAFTAATGSTDVDARRLLAKFGLGPEHLHRPGSTLSPGERTRASLALLMATGANLLVLDEPTNHLDLAAIEQLEAALSTFSGTLLVVTHDRALLASLDLTRVVRVDDGRVVEVDDGRIVEVDDGRIVEIDDDRNTGRRR